MLRIQTNHFQNTQKDSGIRQREGQKKIPKHYIITINFKAFNIAIYHFD